MRIRVLWIDDEYKKQTDVIGDAEQDGIDLIPFESHEEGMSALMSDIKGFHAVILDAKVKKNKVDTVTGLSGLAASRDRLIELNQEGIYLPYFIFTGQPDYMDNDTFKESYGKYYIKGIDNQNLFDKIKDCVEKKEEYLIHRDYKRVFDFCNKHFDVETKKTLTNILQSIRKPQSSFSDELYFTQLRVVLERLFRLANKIGWLHDKCLLGGKVNLTESSLFLAGENTKHLNVYCTVKHFPKIIAEGVKNILFVTGAASHTSDPDFKNNLDLQAYRQLIKSPYLLYSLAYQLLDTMIWFDEYLKEKSDYSLNVSYWVEEKMSDLVIGKVTRIADNGYGTFLPNNDFKTLSILPSLVNEHKLIEGQDIKVSTKKDGVKTLITEIILI
jgi:hypothetical protein